MKRFSGIRIHTALELRKMQVVATRLYEILRQITDVPLIDVESRVIEHFVGRRLQRYGLTSAMQAYRGYPSVVSVCINDVAVHGVPGDQRIQRGDVVSIDIAARSDGFVGDTAWTYLTPGVSQKSAGFVRDAWRAFCHTLAACRVGTSIQDIGNAAAEGASLFGLSVVPEFVGHGIGRKLHEPPVIPFRRTDVSGTLDEVVLQPGMILNIEPVFSAGESGIELLEDGLGYRLRDGSISAHFELSLAVARDGAKVLQLAGVPVEELPASAPFSLLRH